MQNIKHFTHFTFVNTTIIFHSQVYQACGESSLQLQGRLVDHRHHDAPRMFPSLPELQPTLVYWGLLGYSVGILKLLPP